MGNRKYIIILAVLAMLSTGLNPSFADSSNSLVQMDVKKSSVTDTVDVTFYTTSNTQNSVVTRKSNNRYVVLLPNISSSSSATPSIGAVKDLISNVEVKHVNDGIGGYTKVTFETTKPINIKTFTKRSNAVTSVHNDYKNIIAQNNVKTPQKTQAQTTTQPKTTATPTTTKPATTTKAPAEKPVAKVATKPVTQAKTEQKQQAKKENIVTKPKTTQETTNQTKVAEVVKNVQKKTVEPQKPAPQEVTRTPKTQIDENGKRVLNLEPEVSHKVENSEAIKQTSSEETTEAKTTQEVVSKNEATSNKLNDMLDFGLPLWLMIAGGALCVGLILGVIRSLVIASVKKQTSLRAFVPVSSPKKNNTEGKYSDIVNNIEMNWQEKYKRYSEQEEQEELKKSSNKTDLSYVTNLGATQKAVLTPAQSIQPVKSTKTDAKKPISSVLAKSDNSKIKIKQISTSKEDFKNQMRAKISQMEHSLAQTPNLKEPEEISNEVKSEDTSIIKSLSKIKLKSFAKPISLKESTRDFVEDDKISKNSLYKEGRFVDLKNSPLSISRRNSASYKLNASDLMDVGNKYLTNIEEIKMNKEKESYLLSSLDEYLSILDQEGSSNSTSIQEKSLHFNPSSKVMSRSGVTNPISKNSEPSSISLNSLIIKSGHKIDSERGFYLVNMDGVSAIIGKVKNSTFMLKKFDSVVDGPLQVRRDEADVYIVRVGGFKCLVNVSQDKMGTLIEI